MDINTLLDGTGTTATPETIAQIAQPQSTSILFPSEMFATGPLVTSFIISTIGFSYFMYGKKNGKTSSLVVGIVMMGFPYFVHNVTYMIGIGVILCIVPFFIRG